MRRDDDDILLEENIALSFLTDLSNELRSRRIAEYTYSSAAIAVFGALVFGISELIKDIQITQIRMVLLTAIILIILLTISIIWKIEVEHKIYGKIKNDIKKLVKIIKEKYTRKTLIPLYYYDEKIDKLEQSEEENNLRYKLNIRGQLISIIILEVSSLLSIVLLISKIIILNIFEILAILLSITTLTILFDNYLEEKNIKELEK